MEEGSTTAGEALNRAVAEAAGFCHGSLVARAHDILAAERDNPSRDMQTQGVASRPGGDLAEDFV